MAPVTPLVLVPGGQASHLAALSAAEKVSTGQTSQLALAPPAENCPALRYQSRQNRRQQVAAANTDATDQEAGTHHSRAGLAVLRGEPGASRADRLALLGIRHASVAACGRLIGAGCAGGGARAGISVSRAHFTMGISSACCELPRPTRSIIQWESGRYTCYST